MDKLIIDLIRTDQTIFSVADLSYYIKHSSIQYLRNRISFYVKKWILTKIAKWIYATRQNYDKYELANKIYSPSYISFFSSLYYHKVIFQYQNDVYLAYMKSTTKKLDNFNIILKNLKDSLLFNPTWIEIKEYYSIASKERAFLDTLYIFWETYFDNLDSMDWEKIKSLLMIYSSPKLEKLVKTYLPK